MPTIDCNASIGSTTLPGEPPVSTLPGGGSGHLPPIGPPSTLGMSYDYEADYEGTIPNGTTLKWQYHPVLRVGVTLGHVGLTSPDADGISFVLMIDGVVKVTATRSSGAWTVNGVAIGSADTVVCALAASIPMPQASLLQAQLTAGADLTAFGASWGP